MIYRERCWNLGLTEEELIALLQRRLFDAGAPREAARQYLKLSRMASEALAKRYPLRKDLEEVRRSVEGLRQGKATPRMADTIARMEEALGELSRLLAASDPGR